VVILFNESSHPVDPSWFKSQFNHCFVLVEKVQDMTTTHYRIEVAYKEPVRPIHPFLPYPAVFEKSEKSRRWLLAKLLNLEAVAQCTSPSFVRRLDMARAASLQGIVDQYQQPSPDKAQRKQARRSGKVDKKRDTKDADQ